MQQLKSKQRQLLFTIYKNSRVSTWNPVEYNFLFVLVENFPEHWNMWEGSPVFRDEKVSMEICAPISSSNLWYQFQASAAIFWYLELIFQIVNGILVFPHKW